MGGIVEEKVHLHFHWICVESCTDMRRAGNCKNGPLLLFIILFLKLFHTILEKIYIKASGREHYGKGEMHLEKKQSLGDEPGRLQRGLPQISHDRHRALLLLLLAVETTIQQSARLETRKTHTLAQHKKRPRVLVQAQKVIYEVHHFCFADF